MIQTIEQPDAVTARGVREFLERVGEGAGVCPEHDPRWLDVLRDGLGHRPYMLIARGEDGAICGYLPLALVRSRLFGRFLVSLPYLNRAGVVAEDRETARGLIDEAVGLSERLGVDYLELRHQGGAAELIDGHSSLNGERDEKVRMVLSLPSDGEVLWKGLDAKVRNQVRKGDKNGLSIQWGGVDRLDEFYSVFSVNMRDLGTPVYPRRLFASILGAFDGEAELGVVSYQGRVVAGSLLIHVGGVTQVPSASCLRAFNRTNANMWMYWRLLERAIERGSGSFDFGRSSVDSGTYRFKKQWGAEQEATRWQYHVRQGDIARMRPDSPKQRRRVEVWKRLPVWLTRCIGPAIVRGIP